MEDCIAIITPFVPDYKVFKEEVLLLRKRGIPCARAHEVLARSYGLRLILVFVLNGSLWELI